MQEVQAITILSTAAFDILLKFMLSIWLNAAHIGLPISSNGLVSCMVLRAFATLLGVVEVPGQVVFWVVARQVQCRSWRQLVELEDVAAVLEDPELRGDELRKRLTNPME